MLACAQSRTYPRSMPPCERVFLAGVLSVLLSIGGNEARAESVRYWQQSVHYRIDVTLDTRTNALDGTERLLYTNNSPDTLCSVWFHAYPNAYRSDSTVFAREAIAGGERPSTFRNFRDSGFMDFLSLTFDDQPAAWSYKPGDNTEVNVLLPHPLEPGATGRFNIAFHVKIPIIYSRLGRDGDHYDITQWYPKIVVYDQSGWHPDGYHVDGEFYGDFGTFDVAVTLSVGYTVASTGVLVAPVSEFARLDSIAAVTVGRRPPRFSRPHPGWPKPLEPGLPSRGRRATAKGRRLSKPSAGMKTLRFHAENVHDFAWFADPSYLLYRSNYHDTAIEVYVLPRDRYAWRGAPGWIAETLAWFGDRYGEYPYPRMSVADGRASVATGMEYPSIILISGIKVPWTRLLENVMVHETGHQWFYGMLGSNEMDEAWLDEGIDTYCTTRYFEEKYGPTKNLMDLPHGLRWLPGVDARWVYRHAWRSVEVFHRDIPILHPAWDFGGTYFAVDYARAALGLHALQASVGDSVFDRGMAAYARDWRFRHPHSDDFVHAMEAASGRKLRSFFDDFLSTTKRCDYALGAVRDAPDSNGRSYDVSIEVLRKAPLRFPSVPVRLFTRDGERYDARADGDALRDTLRFRTRAPVRSVVIDPDDRLLELSHRNNRRPLEHRWMLGPSEPSPSRIDTEALPYLFYKNDVDGAQIGFWTQTGHPIVQRPLVRTLLYYAAGSGRVGAAGIIRTRIPFNEERNSLQLAFKNEQGYDQERLTFTTRFRERIVSWSMTEFTLGAFRNELYNLAAYQPGDWERARSIGVEGGVRWSSESWRGAVREEFGVRPVLAGDFPSTRVDETLDGAIRPASRGEIGARFYIGAIAGRPALQDRIYLAGGLDPDRLDPWVIDRRGSGLIPLRHHWIDQGPALAGYAGLPTGDPAGRAGMGLRLELRSATADSPVGARLYAEAGEVTDRWSAMRLSDFVGDAGIRLDVGPVSLVLPVWVSRPAEDDLPLHFRLVITTRSIIESKILPDYM